MPQAPDGPGPVRRSPLRAASSAVARGFVPTVVAAHAAGMAWSRFGIPERGAAVAAVVFAFAWVGTLFLLRSLSRRRATRIALRILLAAHVAFWSGRGLLHARVRPSGPIHGGVATVWAGTPQPFLAGVGEASFGLTDRDTLAGYGAPPRRTAAPWPAPGPLVRLSLAGMARPGTDGKPAVPTLRPGVPGADALGARALVLVPSERGAPLAVVRLDLVLVDPRVRDAVLQRVSDLGVTDDTLLLCATHTHSGPGGFAQSCLARLIATDHLREDVVARCVAAAADAIRAAHRDAVPARLGFVRAKDLGPDRLPVLAANRSGPDRDRLDTEVLGIRFDAADGSRRVALLLNYAVHPVWGRPSDTAFSRDLAGALERSAALADGATTVFVNGAEGDVKPRSRPGKPDRPDPVAAFEQAVAEGLRARATEDRLRVVAATVRRDFGSPRFVKALVGAREPVLAAAEGPFGRGVGGAAAAALCLPLNALLWGAFCDDARIVGSFDGGVGVVVSLDPYLGHTTFPMGAVRLETPTGTAAIVWTPGEPTTAVGERIKDAGRLRGARPVYVFGLTNDHLAYVATSDEVEAGTYEGDMTLFGPGTADALLDGVERALDAVGLPAPDVPR